MVDIIQKLDSISGQNMIVIVGIGRVSPPQTEKHGQWRAETEEVLYSEQEAALGRLRRLGGVGEISPATSRAGWSGDLAGAPGVLHVLAPAAQHVVGDNTACKARVAQLGNKRLLWLEILPRE